MSAAKLVIQALGVTLFIVLLAAFVWSLTQPPVLNGPMPDPFAPRSTPDQKR